MGEKYYSEIKELSLSSNTYVLVLPGWYPDWHDPFLGDFNQRHVKAAALHTSQVVLYIVKDQSNTLTKTQTRYNQVNENMAEIIVMYPQKKNKWVDIIHSNLKYVQLLYAYADLVKKRWGKPLLIHSYIVIRGGVGGLLLGKKWKLPFILSENWTMYYPSDPGYFGKRNFIFKWIVRRVYKSAKWFLPVTNNLKQQVETLCNSVPSTVIPNVVETDVFSYNIDRPGKTTFRFIHVSAMTYQKNPQGLLRSFKNFNDLHAGSSLWMVGPYTEDVLNFARDLGLNEKLVHFTGPVSYSKVAQYVKASDSLVLFSRYENLPCVILEALCCGLPVISTSVGGISEVIDIENGILTGSEKEEELTAAFTSMYKNYSNYNRKKIAESAIRLYSYSVVAGLIKTVYSNLNQQEWDKKQEKI